MEKEFISFQEAVEDLGVEDEDLKRMVSDGEIRAYRDSGEVQFRSEDLSALKEGMDTEPMIDLGNDSSPSLQTEPSNDFVELTAADFEDEIAIETTPPPAKPKPAPVLEDTVIGFEIEDDGPADEEETFVLAPEDDPSATIPLQLLDEEELVPEASTEVVGVSEIQTPDMLGLPPRFVTRTSPLFLALLMVSTALLLYGAILVIGFVSTGGNVPEATVSEPLTDWFLKLF